MFDVFGNTIDHLPPMDKAERRNIHRSPPPLADRSVKSEIFQTGIKAIDVLIPLERGGKAGLFGGAGVGKTVLLTEMIHNMVGHNPVSYTHLDVYKRQIKDLLGFRIAAKDGDIGMVKDFYFDDETWTVRYLSLIHI